MTNRKISSILKFSFFAVMMTMMAMTMAACGTDEETACQSYDTGSNDYEVAADSGYDYDYESSFDNDYANEANTNSGTSDSSVSTDILAA